MGEEFATPRETLSDNIVIGMPFLAEKAEALALAHHLAPSAELEELLDHLFGLSCRDQERVAFDPGKMAQRRQNGYALAKSMRKQAADMLIGLGQLHRDWIAFNQQVQFNPALLEMIFEINTGMPEEAMLPNDIAVIQSLFPVQEDQDLRDFFEESQQPIDLATLPASQACPEGLWEAVDIRLAAVADLPIRHRLPRGPVPNLVVRDALIACRNFWRGLGRRWSMAGLKHVEVRHDNAVGNLSGACEKFVAAALTTAGIAFYLAELHSAWETIDAAARREAASRPAPK